MTRVVGQRNRSEIEPDPVEAFRRGRQLDAMLRAASPPPRRGVRRATHSQLNAIDDERALAMASRLNSPR